MDIHCEVGEEDGHWVWRLYDTSTDPVWNHMIGFGVETDEHMAIMRGCAMAGLVANDEWEDIIPHGRTKH